MITYNIKVNVEERHYKDEDGNYSGVDVTPIPELSFDIAITDTFARQFSSTKEAILHILNNYVYPRYYATPAPPLRDDRY